MTYDILLQRLTQGEIIHEFDSDGNVINSRIERPNRHMLRAAKVIQQLVAQLHNARNEVIKENVPSN